MKTKINLRLSGLIRVLFVRMKKSCIRGCSECAQRRFGSDCANAQADLNLRLAYMSEGTFPGVAAHRNVRLMQKIINEDTQAMSQSRTTTFARHQNKEK